jgi:4'-phosphopantetheinyl transferase
MNLNRSGWSLPPDPLVWPQDEVHVWRTTLDWPDESIAGLPRYLSADERGRVERFRFERDRRHSLVARGVLRMVLGRYLGMSPQEVRFGYGPAGKPHLATGQPLQFNLSHAGALLLIAVANGRALGVDVEQVRTDFEVEDVATHFFSPAEQRALATLAGASQVGAFFACWTRKEAYIKALGDGLSHPLDQFDVSLLPGEEACLIGTRPDPAEARRWRLAALDVAEGYKAALAVEGAELVLRCWDWPSGIGRPWGRNQGVVNGA